MDPFQRDPASFRDPDAFIVRQENACYRILFRSYQPHYDQLISSGLYDKLVSRFFLIAHSDISKSAAGEPFLKGMESDIYKILLPEQVPFISYAYEWSFSQLRDAALLTLDIELQAIEYGMMLKDANSYNIQFLNGSPVLIDLPSFEKVPEHYTWRAYKQFCEHFLGPLALMSYTDIDIPALLKQYMNGIPLAVTTSMLPFRAKLNPGLAIHLYLQNRYQKKAGQNQTQKDPGATNLSKAQHKNIITQLRNTISNLKGGQELSNWKNYYVDVSAADPEYFEKKKEAVSRIAGSLSPRNVWDIGANNGIFSFIAAKTAHSVFAMENDKNCLDAIYRFTKKEHLLNVVPVYADVTNPTPGLGWNNSERKGLWNRLPLPDLTMALAVIHHLVITNGISLEMLAAFFSERSSHLLIEFISGEDPRVKFLQRNRESFFRFYTRDHFENAFLKHYEILERITLSDEKRFLYHMKRKSSD